MVLSMSVFVHTVIVLGPAKPPSPETLISILKFGNVDGALLAPVSIEYVCSKAKSGLFGKKRKLSFLVR